ncbi:PIN domain-containing protein [Ramlibacter sp. H39-3-26]|uniref:PIN domain-containing protein n=1 Tax=Curvibacter soli TaxID=3031331 RepID=UPI0023DA879E|nr:PIN domain-containing protein [Ramlibacter sp. H39-3-26]MDF1485612.1 PIN domain-containing protein [Ramlibacter sp. H39-3-26]
MPFDAAGAHEAAAIRAELESRGLPIGPHDVLIAGTVRAHGATLVTRNEREFSRVPALQWVNWHAH